MKKYLKAKSGFTFVEMIIVVAIIASLSVLAVGGYISYRKSALLSFAVDDFLSELAVLRSKTAFGVGNQKRFDQLNEAVDLGDDKIGAENFSSDCYLVKFVDGVPTVFRTNFSGEKIFREGKMAYKGCEVDSAEELRKFDLDSAIVVDGDLEGMIIFSPPNGFLEATIEDLIFAYADDESGKFVRKLHFDRDKQDFIIVKDE